MKILAIGDSVGEPARKAILQLYPKIKERHGIDFCVVNGENLAGGNGITAKTAEELLRGGIDVISNGDHVWDQKDAVGVLNSNPRLLRPANYPEPCLGRGITVVEAKNGVKVAVLNLLGRVFLKSVDCPFKTADRLLAELPKDCKVVVVDMHAEATSEKVAIGWYLDGRVSAIFGTHTHIQTADERVLPKGTGYLTDVGMTGPYDSVIGREIEPVLHRFITQLPAKMPVAEKNVKLCGAVFDVDEATGKCRSVTRIVENLPDGA